MLSIWIIAINMITHFALLNDKLSDIKRSDLEIVAPGNRELLPFRDGHKVENYLPRGYVKNGTVDYTEFIQKAISNHDKIIFPGFPLLINDRGLKIGSNKSIIFLKGSELHLKSSMKTHYAILDLKGVENVSLYNPVIIGDRYHHLGGKGEWGMGISIKGSSKIKVFGANVKNCWGDGIYIGQDSKIKVNRDILISKAVLTKNRRDGISIISVDGLILEDVYAGYQDGTKPMCGINFEPNNPTCQIKNVKVINPKTEYNQGSGIQIGVRTLLGGGRQNIDVKIINHFDQGSKSFALKVSCKRKEGVYGGNVSGLVSIINPTWNATIGDRPLAFMTDQRDLRVTVLSPKVKKSNGKTLNSSEVRAVLSKHSNGSLEIF